jgi:hypothetical protein
MYNSHISLLIIYLVNNFLSIGQSKVEYEVATLRVRKKVEFKSLGVVVIVSNPSL